MRLKVRVNSLTCAAFCCRVGQELVDVEVLDFGVPIDRMAQRMADGRVGAYVYPRASHHLGIVTVTLGSLIVRRRASHSTPEC